jgi:hypothetical protein
MGMRTPLISLLAGLLSGCIYYEPVPDQARRPLSAANASSGLSKEDVLRLTQAAVPEDAIIAKINADGIKARPSADDVIDFAKAGVSERVIQAMLRGRLATSAGDVQSVETMRYYGYYYPPAWWGSCDPWWGYHGWDHHGFGHHY